MNLFVTKLAPTAPLAMPLPSIQMVGATASPVVITPGEMESSNNPHNQGVHE